MKRSTLIILIISAAVVIGAILLLVFTSGNMDERRLQDDAADNVLVREANVEEIDIELLESFPVQVIARAYGTLPDGCTEISSIEQERNGNTFDITIMTERPRDAVCTQIMRDFEQPIDLDVVDLPRGEYLVNINGVQDLFTLTMDNQVEFDAGSK